MTVRGISIINGAQTVGSLARIDPAELSDLKLPLRVVKPDTNELTTSIIRFNNTQNTVEAWELRSIDRVQRRITEDFERELGLIYEKRRGQTRRSSEAIHFDKLAPWISSFLGDSYTPHRSKRDLYESDQQYSRLFNNQTDIRNLSFIYRIGETIQTVKDDYKASAGQPEPADTDVLLYGYFQYGAFQYALIALVARALRTIHASGDAKFGNRIRFCKDDLARDRNVAVDQLAPLIRFVLLAVPVLLGSDDPYSFFRSRENLEDLETRLAYYLQQHETMQPGTFDSFREVTCVY